MDWFLYNGLRHEGVNHVNYRRFRHIQVYSRPIQTYSTILWYIWNPVQLLHIQNLAIFRILAFLEPNIYSKLYQSIFCHIQNAVQRSHIEN